VEEREIDQELTAALERAVERTLPQLDERMEQFFRKGSKRMVLRRLPLPVAVGLIAFALGLLLGGYFYAQTHQSNWITSSSDHFKAYFWRGIAAEERREALKTLEKDLKEVENLLGREYNSDKRGKIRMVVYVAEVPSETVLKLAGSLARQQAALPAEELTYFVTSPDWLKWDAPRQLTRILIPSSFRPLIDEGVHEYVDICLDKAHTEKQFRLLNQIAAQALAEGTISLQEILTSVFHTDTLALLLWTDFIHFLAERWGMTKFIALYEEMTQSYHYGEDLTQLFQKHYKMGIAALERLWRQSLANTTITEQGRLAYYLAAERLLAKYRFVRPFIKDKEDGDHLSRAILQALGRDLDSLDPTQVKQFIAYLSNSENYIATKKAVEEALNLSLATFTASLYQYIPLERTLDFREAALSLKRYYTQGNYREFMKRYLKLVNETLSRKKEGDAR